MNKNSANQRKNVSLKKEFRVRNSPLTDKFENSEDVRTIYNLFAIILISLLTNTIIYDYSKKGESRFGLRLVVECFNRFDLVIVVWFCLNFLASSAYFSFRVWANVRILLKPKTCKFWDKIWTIVLVSYLCISLAGIQKTIRYFAFAAGSATVLILEQIRLLMKQYSFIRNNAPLVLNYKTHSDQSLNLPTFQKFLYFLFAPTLLYRDEYPRTQHIRWKLVVYNLAEVLAIIFLLSLTIERFLIPPFEEICLRKFTVSEVLVPIIGNAFPGILFLLGGFYSVLHAFQNAAAEILRFGDRMFYREWWTSRSFSEYYRTWNVIVHDWLFTYIYKDIYEIVLPKNKMGAQMTVFTVSAIVHEWIIMTALGLFLPILFVIFFLAGGLLSIFRIIDLPVGNLPVWYCIILGSGIIVNLYTLEFFAKINCTVEDQLVGFDSFKPKFITCGCIE